VILRHAGQVREEGADPLRGSTGDDEFWCWLGLLSTPRQTLGEVCIGMAKATGCAAFCRSRSGPQVDQPLGYDLARLLDSPLG
jgi:hypothetical protein